MKNGHAGPVRGIIKLVITLGVPAILIYTWIFKEHLGTEELLKQYFVLIQMLLGAALGATFTQVASGVKSPSLLLLAETVLGAVLGGWLCKLIFGLIVRIVFKLGVIIGAVICVALILGSFAVGASTVLGLYEDKVQRAEEIIHKSQSTNVTEDLRGFRNADGREALREAERRIGHGIK